MNKSEYNQELKLIRPLLLSFATSKNIGIWNSEDLVQKTLLILHKKANDYNPNKSIKNWGFAILKFQIKAFFSSVKREKVFAFGENEELILNSAIHCTKKTPLDYLVLKERRMIYRQIIKLVNKKEATIIKLVLKGVKPIDIMNKLKISQSNYSVSKFRAIQKVKLFFKNKSIVNYTL